MKRFILFLLSILFCFLMQSTVFHVLNFGGVVPNLLMIVTATYGFMHGRKVGMATGLLSGALLDLFFGQVPGLYTLLYVHVGYLNGYFSKIFFPEDMRLPLMLIAFSDLLYNLVIYALMFLLRGRFNFGYYLANIIIPEIIYTMVVSLGLYPVILRIDRRLIDEQIRQKYNKGQEVI